MLGSGMVIVYDDDYAAFYNNGVKEVEGENWYVEEYVFRMLNVRQHSSANLFNPRNQEAWETTADLNLAEQAEIYYADTEDEVEEKMRRVRPSD